MATGTRFAMIAFAMLTPFMLSLMVDSADAYSLRPRFECDWICSGLDLVYANKDDLVTVSGSAFGEKYNVDIVAPIYSEEERAIFVIVVIVIVATISILVILCFCCMCCCGGNRRRSQPQIYMLPANDNPAAAAVAPPPPNNFGPAGFGAPLYPGLSAAPPV